MLTDRSRIESYQVCPRLRFLKYHYGGLGIAPTLDSYYLGFGLLYHQALEMLLNGTAVTLVVRELSPRLQSLIETMAERAPLPSVQYANEQRYLFEGLIYAYARVRLPEILNSYTVVALEQELLWTIGEVAPGEPLIDMLRLDALLADPSGSLYYKEYKTTSYGDDKWALEFENNSQVMANLRAVEVVLQKRPAGVLIEGHKKGRRRRDTAKMSRYTGSDIQDSIFCYAFESGPGNVTLDWRARGVRMGVWELGFSPERWVREYLNDEDCLGQFVSLPPISPDPYVLDRWQRQTLAQETLIYQGLEELASTDDPLVQRAVLDRVFPLHETSCIRYGMKCSHYEVCHNAAVRSEPLSSPLFVRRTPHHDAERNETLGTKQDD